MQVPLATKAQVTMLSIMVCCSLYMRLSVSLSLCVCFTEPHNNILTDSRALYSNEAHVYRSSAANMAKFLTDALLQSSFPKYTIP